MASSHNHLQLANLNMWMRITQCSFLSRSFALAASAGTRACATSIRSLLFPDPTAHDQSPKVTTYRMAAPASSVGALLNDPKYADLEIRCDGKSFKLHRAIVCPRSKVLDIECSGGFLVDSHLPPGEDVSLIKS